MLLLRVFSSMQMNENALSLSLRLGWGRSWYVLNIWVNFSLNVLIKKVLMIKGVYACFRGEESCKVH